MGFAVNNRVADELSAIAEKTGMSKAEIARRGLIRELKELQQMCNKAER